jgi:hypothetical protein
MDTATPKSLTLNKAVVWSIAQQVLVFACASFTDLNVFTATQITLHAMAAYWVWFFIFAWRRRASPTRTTVLMVTWGFLGAWVLSFIVSQLVWGIRGW